MRERIETFRVSRLEYLQERHQRDGVVAYIQKLLVGIADATASVSSSALLA